MLVRGRSRRFAFVTLCTPTIAARGGRDRHRRRHDRRAGLRRRRGGRARRLGATGSSRSTSRSPGWVEHDADDIRDAVRRHAGRAGRALRRHADRRHRHHQPARDGRGVGPRAPASRSHRALVWQDRRTRARPATRSATPAMSRWCGPRPGSCSTPTSPPRSSGGSCQPRAASSRRPTDLAVGTVDCWVLWNLTGGRRRRARHRRVERVAHAALRHHHAVVGRRTRELFGVSAAFGALPEIRPTPASSAAPWRHGVPAGIPDRRDRRRPAGGAVRPGLFHAGDDQEHLRHRQLRAHERRRRRARARSRDCSPPSPGSWPTAPSPTPSRARSSSPARPSSGCATGSASSTRRPRSARSPSRSPTPTACSSCPPSPASAARGGTRTPAARSSASRAGPAGPTSPGRSSRRWRSRPATSSTRCAPRRAATCSRCGSTAARRSWTCCCQFQADQLQVPVARRVVQETTALGAAYLAGLADGVWSSLDEIAAQWALERDVQPRARAAGAGQHASRARGCDAVDRARGTGQPRTADSARLADELGEAPAGDAGQRDELAALAGAERPALAADHERTRRSSTAAAHATSSGPCSPRVASTASRLPATNAEPATPGSAPRRRQRGRRRASGLDDRRPVGLEVVAGVARRARRTARRGRVAPRAPRPSRARRVGHRAARHRPGGRPRRRRRRPARSRRPAAGRGRRPAGSPPARRWPGRRPARGCRCRRGRRAPRRCGWRPRRAHRDGREARRARRRSRHVPAP